MKITKTATPLRFQVKCHDPISYYNDYLITLPFLSKFHFCISHIDLHETSFIVNRPMRKTFACTTDLYDDCRTLSLSNKARTRIPLSCLQFMSSNLKREGYI